MSVGVCELGTAAASLHQLVTNKHMTIVPDEPRLFGDSRKEVKKERRKEGVVCLFILWRRRADRQTTGGTRHSQVVSII